MGTLGTIVRGAAAGLVGALAMDALWYRRHRESGGEDDFAEWELTEADNVQEAGAPAQMAEKVTDAVGVDVPDEHAGTVNDVVHWLTGAGYGIGHAMLNGRRNALVGGVLTGVGALTNSYTTLGAVGVYEPVWEYDPETLAQDASAHLVYGVATGLTYAALSALTNGERAEGTDGTAGDA